MKEKISTCMYLQHLDDDEHRKKMAMKDKC